MFENDEVQALYSYERQEKSIQVKKNYYSQQKRLIKKTTQSKLAKTLIQDHQLEFVQEKYEKIVEVLKISQDNQRIKQRKRTFVIQPFSNGSSEFQGDLITSALIDKEKQYENMKKKLLLIINDKSMTQVDYEEAKLPLQVYTQRNIIVQKFIRLYQGRTNKTGRYRKGQNGSVVQKEFTQFENQQRKDYFVFSPDQYTRLIWDFLCIFLILFEMIMVPFRISFQDEDFSIFEKTDTIFDVIFLCDIVLNFNTAVFIKGQLNFDRKSIAIYYLQLWFWLDLVSSFPYSLIVDSMISNPGQNQSFLRLVKFLRFLKIIRLLRVIKLKNTAAKLSQILELSDGFLAFLGFIRLALGVLFLAHWIACLWHGIGNFENDQNWMIHAEVYNEAWQDRYITSIYWSVTTMITVGYGDIVPITNEEKIFAISTMLISCAVFGYSLNTMGAMLDEINAKGKQTQKDMQAANKYMKAKNVSWQLQDKIRKYLEYIWENKKKKQNNVNDILEKLNTHLRRDFIFEVNSKILENSCLLNQNFSEKLVYHISLIMKETITTPHEIIFLQDSEDYPDKSLYYLQTGSVDICYRNTDTIFAQIQEGQFFGEIGFITNKRTASARSTDFCNLFYIKRDLFIDELKLYQKDLETFCHMRDNINLYQDYRKLKLKCYQCQKLGHIIVQCPDLEFNQFREKLVKKTLKKNQCLRQPYERIKKHKQDQRLMWLRTQQNILQFLNSKKNDGICNTSDQDQFHKENAIKIQGINLENQFESNQQRTSIDQNLIDSNLNQQIKKSSFSSSFNFFKVGIDVMSIQKYNEKMPMKLEVEQVKKEFLRQLYLSQIEEYDVVKEYNNYFVWNNVSNVCKLQKCLDKQKELYYIGSKAGEIRSSLVELETPSQKLT